MIRWKRLLIAAAVAAWLPPPAAAAPTPAAPSRGRLDLHSERLSDGTELIVARIRSSRRASLRYVVRAGAVFDPPTRRGIAHLVEHVLAGARDGEERLIDAVAAAAGVMNAFTSRDATWYSLDAPLERFPPLARSLLQAVTNPQFAAADVAAVQGVVESEAQVSDDSGLLAAVDEALFPEPDTGPLGTSGTRERVNRDDMLDFFRTRYTTSASTVIVAGDFTPEGARELVENALALPPALPTEAYGPRIGSPQLPKEQEVRAPFHAMLLGYRLDEGDWEACRSAAELVTVRMSYHYQIKRPLLAWTDVGCHRVRGVPFLLASAYARSLDEDKSLPEIIDSSLRSMVELGMTSPERKILEQRRSRTLDRLRDAPDRIADAVAAVAAAPRAGGTTPVDQLETGIATAAQLREFARRTLVPDRRLGLTFTPY